MQDKTVPPGIVDRVRAKSEAAGIEWSRWQYNDNTCKPQVNVFVVCLSVCLSVYFVHSVNSVCLDCKRVVRSKSSRAYIHKWWSLTVRMWRHDWGKKVRACFVTSGLFNVKIPACTCTCTRWCNLYCCPCSVMSNCRSPVKPPARAVTRQCLSSARSSNCFFAES